jgi:hypothetical protein
LFVKGPFVGIIEEELEGELEDAVDSDPPGAMLGKKLERVARAVLLRHNLGSAKQRYGVIC